MGYEKGPKVRARKPVVIIYFLGLFFIGLGYLAILPPFEGIDEIAYYSGIRQIADTGTLPVYGKSFFPEDVAGYSGPMPYDSQKPPYNRGMTYSKFFARPELADRYLQAYRQFHPHPPYVPSQKSPNWEAQHPPLYYGLMALLMKATGGLSFVAEIFVLRLASFMLALGGVMLGLAALRRRNSTAKLDMAFAGFMFYPVIFPMFFPEFARIGNDSLCLFLTGAVAFFLTRGLAAERNPKWPVAVGMALGLGLLTKSYFLPITFTITAFLLLRLWRDRAGKGLRRQRWRNLALIVVPALLIGGGWYVYKLMTVGELTGMGEVILLASKGGLAVNLIRNFSLASLAQGVFVVLVTWVWAGTWSLTRPPFISFVPLLLLVAWVVMAFAGKLKRQPLTAPVWLPAFLFTVFGFGLCYYILVSIAVFDKGNIIPGYYLHILMPWAAPALGTGICSILKKNRARTFLVGLLFYAIVFQVAVLWAQLALFTGCAIKGDNKLYVFSGHAFCLDQIPVLVDRLAIFGWPWLACIGFGGGTLCVLWLFVMQKREGRQHHRAIAQKTHSI